MTGTGLKKCIPTNRPRRSSPTAAASASIEIELVFEAKIAPAGARPSSSDQKARLTSMSSKIASTTRPAAAASPGIRRRPDPAQRRIPGGRVEAALLDCPLEVPGDPVAAGDGPGEVRLVEHHVPTRRGEDLGDAMAHQPGAADEHRIDAIVESLPVRDRDRPREPARAEDDQQAARPPPARPRRGTSRRSPTCRRRRRARPARTRTRCRGTPSSCRRPSRARRAARARPPGSTAPAS